MPRQVAGTSVSDLRNRAYSNNNQLPSKSGCATGVNRSVKRSLLCVDDYGMGGGIWYVVLSDSWDRIADKLPFLECVQNRPDWIEQKHYDRINAARTIAVDNLPTEGILGLTLQEGMLKYRVDAS